MRTTDSNFPHPTLSDGQIFPREKGSCNKALHLSICLENKSHLLNFGASTSLLTRLLIILIPLHPLHPPKLLKHAVDNSPLGELRPKLAEKLIVLKRARDWGLGYIWEVVGILLRLEMNDEIFKYFSCMERSLSDRARGPFVAGGFSPCRETKLS